MVEVQSHPTLMTYYGLEKAAVDQYELGQYGETSVKSKRGRIKHKKTRTKPLGRHP